MARALSLAGPALAAVLALPGAASAQVEGWPARLDFGLSAPDCPGVQALIGLRNAGEAPLVIEEARFEGAGFLALEPAPDFPLTVAPMGRVSFGIRLVSPLDGPWSAELVLETSEGPLTSRLGGTVVSERIDRFVTTPHPKTDALVVIDDAPPCARCRPDCERPWRKCSPSWWRRGRTGRWASSPRPRGRAGGCAPSLRASAS
ncbi:MAG: hypothetical protein H6730_14475 [Deltaproteobacteria bacterium]|nr:hypothetical protein [Deltaproteobacteria bacterium]